MTHQEKEVSKKIGFYVERKVYRMRGIPKKYYVVKVGSGQPSQFYEKYPQGSIFFKRPYQRASQQHQKDTQEALLEIASQRAARYLNKQTAIRTERVHITQEISSTRRAQQGFVGGDFVVTFEHEGETVTRNIEGWSRLSMDMLSDTSEKQMETLLKDAQLQAKGRIVAEYQLTYDDIRFVQRVGHVKYRYYSPKEKK